MLASHRFELQPLPRVVFGAGSIDSLPSHVARAGGSHALVVTDPGLVRAGVIEPVVEALRGAGLPTTVFDGVAPNPSTDNVTAGAEAARGLDGVVIVALGGGSSLDAAKAIGLLANNPGPVAELQLGKAVAQPSLPIIAVPTTAGTGSENNMFAMITGDGRKLYIAQPSARPVVAVLDPQLTLGLPPASTAHCGMDVLTHAVEALVGVGSNPYTDGIALEVIGMVRRYLPAAYDDGADLEARSQLLLASNMASIAFGIAGLGICHGCGHPLSARFGLPHGQALASLLPHVMAFNLQAVAPKYARAAQALGVFEPGRSDADNAHAAIGAVRALRTRVGTARALSEFGVSDSALPQLSQDALADVVTYTNPRPVQQADAEALLKAAL